MELNCDRLTESECDQLQMKRCRDLSHSKASYLGPMGMGRRCFWSHGTAEPAEDANNFAVDIEPDSEVEFVAESANSNRHKDDSPQDAEKTAEDDMVETVPQLGCPWGESWCEWRVPRGQDGEPLRRAVAFRVAWHREASNAGATWSRPR